MLIKAGTLIDGTGESSKEDVGIRVEDEKIVSVDDYSNMEKGENEPEIDASELTVLPGLVEAHTHLLGNGDPEGDAFFDTFVSNSTGKSALNSFRHALLNLEAGFTTIRDAGSRDYVDVALKEMIDEGKFIGPNLFVSGEALAATGGHMDRTKDFPRHLSMDHVDNICDGPTEARKAARRQIKMGADWIKIAASLSEYVRDQGDLYSPELTQETIEEICKVAHWTNRKVGAHCHGGEGVTKAITAGVDVLEHGRFLSEEQLGMMAEKGIYLVPTLSPDARAMENTDEPNQWLSSAYDAMYDTVQKASELGVKIGAGSDASMPHVYHGDTAYELEQLVKAGLSELQAITSATATGAEIVGQSEDLGTIEEGKNADIIAVSGDPLEDITVLKENDNICKVIKNGDLIIDREVEEKRVSSIVS